MSAFDALVKFINPTDVTIALASDPFIAIDRDRAAAKLRLEDRALRNGKSNIPGPESSQFDDVEQEIAAEITEHAVRAQTEAANNHRTYAERLSELKLLRELSAITAASSRALSDFKKTVIERRSRLSLAKDDVRESYVDLASFKKEHRLTRPTHPGLSPLLVWSTIVFSWLLESLANTAFLRVNDDFGLIGGFVAAAVVALINVGISAGVGRFAWPLTLHRNRTKQSVGIAICVAWVVLIVAWNLLAGHFRDAKARGIASPESAALKLFTEQPYQFDSIYSYGLLLAGLTFAILAASASFRADDPYPGYGPLYRRHKYRCDEYSDDFEDSIAELTEIRDDAIRDAIQIREELGRQFRERGHIIAQREMHRSRFREHQDYLETVANALLQQYRTANVMNRADALRPAHFDRHWTLPKSELPAVVDGDAIEAEVMRAQQTLTESVTTISAAYDEAIASFEPLDSIKESLAHGA